MGTMNKRAGAPMTVSDLMNFLQISNKQVYLMIQKGMPYVSIGHHKRFLVSEVIEWMKGQAGRDRQSAS